MSSGSRTLPRQTLPRQALLIPMSVISPLLGSAPPTAGLRDVLSSPALALRQLARQPTPCHQEWPQQAPVRRLINYRLPMWSTLQDPARYLGDEEAPGNMSCFLGSVLLSGEIPVHCI